MKKIVSLLFLIVLSFSMISCLGENQIEGISCTGFETQYFVNEVIDTSNVVVTVKYSVDKSANYTVDVNNLIIDLPDMSTIGTKTIKVTYKVDGKEFSTEKTINVVERKTTLAELVVENNLPKAVYFVGETIDLSGVVLKAFYDVEGLTEQRIEELKYDDFKDGIGELKNTVGKHNVSITYKTKTVVLNYEIKANYIVNFELLNADSINDKYYIGDNIDTSAITAKITYASGDVINVENKDLEFTGVDTSVIGEKELKVSYDGGYATINYKVDDLANRIESMEIIQSIQDKTYYVGDIIDTSVIKVRVNYKEELGLGSIELNASDLEISIVTEANKSTITITYEGYSKEISVVLTPIQLVDFEIVDSLSDLIYYVGDSVDTSVITAKAIFNNGSELLLKAEELTINNIDTKTPGDKVLEISYTFAGVEMSTSITINVLETEYDYTIISVSLPTFVRDYYANSGQVEGLNSEFFIKNNTYLVGNQNPFKFFPTIEALDSSNNRVIVDEYHSYSRLYLINGEEKIELTGDNLTKYVSINEYKSEYQFTVDAADKEFELVVQPYYYRETEKHKVSFRFKVIDGYNVYTSRDLMIMNSDPYYDADWATYYDQNDIVLPKLQGDLTLIIQNPIIIKPTDFPTTFFHQDGVEPGEGVDYQTQIVKGTLKDQKDLFSRCLKQDENFTIYGNYFTLNAESMPLVSNHGLDGSNSQLFYFYSDYVVTKSKVNIYDLELFGNTNKSSEEKDFGGLIGMKIHGKRGNIDFEVNNSIIKSFIISQLTAYEKAKSVFNSCKLYDSYSNLSCNWEQSNTVYNKCYIAESGGPVLVGAYDYNENYPDAYLNIEFNDVEYHSALSGNESWFKAAGVVDKVAMILGLNELAFKQQGGVSGLVNKAGQMSIPVAVVIDGDKHPSKPYALLKVIINGKTIINTVDDPQTIGIIETFLQPEYGAGQCPIFFNSNGMIAYYDNVSLKLITGEELSSGHPFFTTGDYMAMYHSGNIYILDYNPITI